MNNLLATWTWVCCGFVLATCMVPSAWGFDLLDALHAARERDPQWLSAQAQFQQAQEKIPQARSQLLPNASLTGNAMRNDQTIHYPEVNVDQSGGFSARQAAVNLKLPLYHQQNWSGLTEAQQQVEEARSALAAANTDLLQRLIQAYADVLAARAALAENQASQSAYTFQLQQARARFEHGNATVVDADQAQAKADQAAADVIDAADTLMARRSTLAEIIGPLDSEPQALSPNYEPKALTPATLSAWQQLALQNNDSYREKTQAVTVAQIEIRKQRAAFLPTLDLVGSYTRNSEGNSALMGQTGTITHQSEIGVQVTMPLYSGGATNSAVRQAIAALSQAQDELEQERRQLTTQITQAYWGVRHGKAAIAARQQAVISAGIALKSAQKGLQHGMKTQLDVLNAQQQLAGAQKDYTKAQLDTLVNEVKLKTTAGVIAESDWITWDKYFTLEK